MAELLQSTTYSRLFKMIDSADHLSKKAGLTCTVNISKAGAAFGAAGGTVTEVANGWYKVALTTTDTNTLGDLAFYITASGADDTDFCDQVYAAKPANLIQIDGQATTGNNATLNLKQLNIVNSAGDAIVASSTGSNGSGLKTTGNGTGEGITSTGGATGHGAVMTGGGGSANGLKCLGGGNGAGLASFGAGTGHGIHATGGGTSGDGFLAAGSGAEPGIKAVGGATGHGISAFGGSTSGDGISAVGQTSGHGITAAGAGTTKHGVNATGGATTSHGIAATGGGVGNGILATSGAGATGDGIKSVAASTNGNGLNPTGTGTGKGLALVACQDIADAHLDRAAGVETNRTPREALRIMLAALAGKLSGAATTTVSIRDTNDTKNRVVATVDASGNRSAVTLDGT